MLIPVTDPVIGPYSGLSVMNWLDHAKRQHDRREECSRSDEFRTTRIRHCRRLTAACFTWLINSGSSRRGADIHGHDGLEQLRSGISRLVGVVANTGEGQS